MRAPTDLSYRKTYLLNAFFLKARPVSAPGMRARSVSASDPVAGVDVTEL
jgi:hypothetical protein